LKEKQEFIKKFCIKYNLNSDEKISYMDLVTEIGELGKELIKGTDYGNKDFEKTNNLESEIGDTIFSLICLCNRLDIDMDKALDNVIQKYINRFAKKGDIGSGN